MTLPGLTKNQRKNAARRRRHDARARISSRADRTGCPRPDKAAYDMADEAEARIAHVRASPETELYRCRCGYWHHGHVLG